MTSTAPAAAAAQSTAPATAVQLLAAIAADSSPAAAALSAADEYGTISRALAADPVQPHPFDTLDDIKSANSRAGYKWFTPDTLRFFASRPSKIVYGHGLFVSSELDFDGTARRYTVRLALPTGEIETVGEFQQFATSGQAHAFARKVAALWSPVALAYWAPHVAAQRERAAERRRRGLARLSDDLGRAVFDADDE